MSGQVLNMPLRCACLAYFFKKQIGEISSNVQQYTALYVVQDLSINQTFLNSIFPIIVPAGKYTLKLINTCIKIWFQTFPQITKKGKKWLYSYQSRILSLYLNMLHSLLQCHSLWFRTFVCLLERLLEEPLRSI